MNERSNRSKRSFSLTLPGLLAGALILVASPGMPYSLPGEAPGPWEDFFLIEDFADSPVGGLPTGWSWRSKDDDNPKRFEVKSTGKMNFVAAQDSGISVVLLKKIGLNPREYPIMTWCWRAWNLPPEADERYTETNDSAAGVYVIFSRNFIGIPRQIKYLWSTTLPIGTVSRREGIARPWFVVLESGYDNVGHWLQETVDLERDHKRILDRGLPTKTIGIGILTDSDATDTFAAADYADFRLWPREALDQGRIPDHCACLRDTPAVTESGQ